MSTEYNPAGLLDAISAKLELKNDAALARALELAPPVVSKLRRLRMPVGNSFILMLLDREIMTLAEVRAFVPSPYVGAA